MRGTRLRRGLVMAAFACSLVVSVSAAAHSLTPGTVRAPELPEAGAATLDTRYAENRQYILDSAQAAERLHDTGRAAVLRKFAQPGRQFLSFSPVGDGQAVEVLGDLARADRISVVVPGSDTTVDTFDRFGTTYAALNGGARALYAEERRLAPKERVAVVAWYGYDAPRTMSRDVATTGRAEKGGRELRTFLKDLQRVNPEAPVALLCHSYGTVVCGKALKGMDADDPSAPADAVVFGSPGMGVDSRAELHTEVPLWAGRGATDWIARIPNTSIDVLGEQVGFGADPTSPAFGARHFPAGPGEHSDYLRPGGIALENISRIALGRGSEVSA
ncbi:alpha/beta hydrolase [Streptomyces sp. NPDC006660]|uniref:alpha/beta hydrolase n=1 Tax=unclassified Streptomyces TaxID=2593676 RepID=UPI0033ECDC8C